MAYFLRCRRDHMTRFFMGTCVILTLIVLNWHSACVIFHYIRLKNIDWSLIGICTNFIGATYSINLLTIKRKVYRDFSVAFSNYRAEYYNDVGHRWFHRLHLFLLAATLYAIGGLIVTIVFLPHEVMPFYDNWVQSVYFVSLENWTEERIWAIMTLEIVIYVIFVVGGGYYVQAYIIYISLMHIGFLESFEKKIRSEKLLVTRSLILSYRQQFQKYMKSLQLFNDIFSNVFIIWFGVALVSICRVITSLLQSPQPTFEQMLFNFVLYLHSLHGLAVMTAACSGLPNKASSIQVAVHSLSTVNPDVPPPGYDVYAEIQLFLSDLNSSKPGITAGGCFLVTSKFFLSYIGLVITYAVVYLQLNPCVLDKTHNCTAH